MIPLFYNLSLSISTVHCSPRFTVLPNSLFFTNFSSESFHGPEVQLVLKNVFSALIFSLHVLLFLRWCWVLLSVSSLSILILIRVGSCLSWPQNHYLPILARVLVLVYFDLNISIRLDTSQSLSILTSKSLSTHLDTSVGSCLSWPQHLYSSWYELDLVFLISKPLPTDLDTRTLSYWPLRHLDTDIYSSLSSTLNYLKILPVYECWFLSFLISTSLLISIRSLSLIFSTSKSQILSTYELLSLSFFDLEFTLHRSTGVWTFISWLDFTLSTHIFDRPVSLYQIQTLFILDQSSLSNLSSEKMASTTNVAAVSEAEFGCGMSPFFFPCWLI